MESKNGVIIRKQLGYVHIPQHWAPQLNAFHRDHLNPYINFHRPCFSPVASIDAKGKIRKRYPYKAMMTPYEKFTSLTKPEQYLKPERTFQQLETIATALSDHEAAKQLKAANTHCIKPSLNRTIGQSEETGWWLVSMRNVQYH